MVLKMNGNMAAAGAPAAAIQKPAAPVEKAVSNGIQSHYDKASSVCGHIDDLVAALTELHEANAKWRGKYIAAKKSHFSKFFGASSTMLMGNTFREWKRLAFEAEAERKLVILQHEMEDQKAEYEKKLAHLEDMYEQRLAQLDAAHSQVVSEMGHSLESQKQACEKVERERNVVQTKASKIYKVMQSMKGQLADCESCDPNVLEEMEPTANVHPADNFEFLKCRLHDLLNQIDPKYVPPLGSLSLMPAPQSSGCYVQHVGNGVPSMPATPNTGVKPRSILQPPSLSMSAAALPH